MDQAGEWEEEEACRQPLRDNEETQCLSWGRILETRTLTSLRRSAPRPSDPLPPVSLKEREHREP